MMSNPRLSDAKTSAVPANNTEYEISDSDPVVYTKGGTAQDGEDMHRMGKLQQLRVCGSNSPSSLAPSNYYAQRNFRISSIFGYSVVMGCTWEYALVYVSPSKLTLTRLTCYLYQHRWPLLDEWRHRGRHLALLDCLFWDVLRGALLG